MIIKISHFYSIVPMKLWTVCFGWQGQVWCHQYHSHVIPVNKVPEQSQNRVATVSIGPILGQLWHIAAYLKQHGWLLLISLYIYFIIWPLQWWFCVNINKSVIMVIVVSINSSSSGQNGCHFADDILKCIWIKGKICIMIQSLLLRV